MEYILPSAGGQAKAVVYLYFLCAGVPLGIALGIGARYLSKWLSEYTIVTAYEVTSDMVPVERELVLEIARSYGQSEQRPKSYSYSDRRQIRLDLESIRNQLQHILTNAAKPRNWASTDWGLTIKNKLEHPPDLFLATKRVLKGERELRSLTRRVLFRIWLWNVTRFHARQWGPVPDINKLPVLRVLELYESLKLAAVNLARCYGEAGVGEDIAASM